MEEHKLGAIMLLIPIAYAAEWSLLSQPETFGDQEELNESRGWTTSTDAVNLYGQYHMRLQAA